MDERPDALLKSALEKIVYFEARAEQLSNDLEAARAEAQRGKLELAAASQREIDVRKQVAALEVRETRYHHEKEELARINEALRGERAALIGKLLEASRIHDSDQPAQEAQAGIDLASFISELRSEVLAGRAAAVAAPAPSPVVAVVAAAKPSSLVAQHAERLAAEGRLEVSQRELRELSAAGETFPGKTEETLFGFSVRELSAPDATSRQRAAERLKALGHPAAAPALATALHGESEPRVQVALLAAFATFAKDEGIPIVTPLLNSPTPDVRISALKALIALDAGQAGPHLAAATQDPDPAVRRRASLLALNLSGEAALALGERAIRDENSEVRALAALVLGASGGGPARQLLQGALRDREPKVRQAAAQSLSRILGTDVSGVVGMDDAQRRREVRRLSALPAHPVLRPFVTAPRPPPAANHPAQAARSAVALTREAASPVPPSSAPLAAPAPRVVSEELCSTLVLEIRSAIRGRSLPDLAQATSREALAVEEALGLLAARGQVIRRGAKYFAA